MAAVAAQDLFPRRRCILLHWPTSGSDDHHRDEEDFVDLMINYCNIMIEMWKAHSAMEVFAMRFAHCVCYYIFFMTRLSNSMHRKEIIMR